MNINFNAPFNPVSFGQVSVALTRAAFQYKKEADLNLSIFPIGGVDISCQRLSKDFAEWLELSINHSISFYKRQNPTFKLWHINGGLESFGRDQHLITFHETDQLTSFEKQILSEQESVIVTSNYTKDVMEDAGLSNVRYLELGFDKDNFYSVSQRNAMPGVVTFGIFGKLEFRKAHEKAIRAWIAKYGNNPSYRLLAAIVNPHFAPEQMNAALNNLFEGKRYWNVTIVPHVKTNAEYNDIINNIDIVIGCSRGEGRDLPVFHAVGLGKHCVGLNAHAYRDYLDNDNAVLIEPCGMVKAVDNIFFHDGAPFNQGNFYDWNVDDFLSACEVAVKRYNAKALNVNGLKLQEKTYLNTWKSLVTRV